MTAVVSSSQGTLHAGVSSIMRDAAERSIMPRYRRLSAGDVAEKAPEEFVTIADRESEAILSDGLARLISDAAIVGEEAADADPSILDRLGNSLCWVIDPLDGTANFMAGDGPFGILVALADRGTPIGGWILDPRSGRFVAAFEGDGTFVDGERTLARASGAAVPIAAVSSLFAESPDRAQVLKKVTSRFSAVSIPRCAAEQYPAMIGGGSDVAVFERTLPWDHAAGVVCLIEAGGIATRFDGSPYRVDDGQSGLAAATTMASWRRFRSCWDDTGTGSAHVDRAAGL